MNVIGKNFKVKGAAGYETRISIIDFDGSSLLVHMTHMTLWGCKESTEQLSNELFESCIRTGYIQECA